MILSKGRLFILSVSHSHRMSADAAELAEAKVTMLMTRKSTRKTARKVQAVGQVPAVASTALYSDGGVLIHEQLA